MKAGLGGITKGDFLPTKAAEWRENSASNETVFLALFAAFAGNKKAPASSAEALGIEIELTSACR